MTDAPPSPTAEARGGEPKRLPAGPQLLVVRPLGPAWRTVYLGLGLLKWGTAAALAALAVLACDALAVLAAPGDRPAGAGASVPTEAQVRLLTIDILSALSVVLGLLGRLCCCFVPSETGARLPAALAFLGALLAPALAGLVVLGIVLVALQAASPFWLVPAVLASGSAALLAEVLFLVFLHQVGRSLQEPAVGRRVLSLVIGTAAIVAGVVFAVLFLATSDAPFLAAPAWPGFTPLEYRALLARFAVLFGVALVLLQYQDLITLTRHALARRLARDADAGGRPLSGLVAGTEPS